MFICYLMFECHKICKWSLFLIWIISVSLLSSWPQVLHIVFFLPFSSLLSFFGMLRTSSLLLIRIFLNFLMRNARSFSLKYLSSHWDKPWELNLSSSSFSYLHSIDHLVSNGGANKLIWIKLSEVFCLKNNRILGSHFFGWRILLTNMIFVIFLQRALTPFIMLVKWEKKFLTLALR